MHTAAFEFVSQFSTMDPLTIIEIGSRDLNGSVRPLFPAAQWIGLDLHPGPAVDVVCDAEHYQPEELVDAVVCCEVLEHAANWHALIATAASWLKPGGRLIVTCAGPGRAEHSAIDGQPRLMPGEYYGNLTSSQVAMAMLESGLGWIEHERVGEDTQAVAWKPE